MVGGAGAGPPGAGCGPPGAGCGPPQRAAGGRALTVRGARRSVSVLGSYQPDNVRRGLLAVLGGVLILVLGGSVLVHLLVP